MSETMQQCESTSETTDEVKWVPSSTVRGSWLLLDVRGRAIGSVRNGGIGSRWYMRNDGCNYGFKDSMDSAKIEVVKNALSMGHRLTVPYPNDLNWKGG